MRGTGRYNLAQGAIRAENPGADTVEHLDADQPEAIVGKGVEHRPDGQDRKPGEKEWLSPPNIGLVPDQKRDRAALSLARR